VNVYRAFVVLLVAAVGFAGGVAWQQSRSEDPVTGAPASSATETPDPTPTAEPTDSPTATPSPTPSPTPAPTPTRDSVLGNGTSVTLAFGGDVHFEGATGDALASRGDGFLAEIAPTLSAADVAVVNLETAITDRGNPAPKEFNFRGPPSGLTALKAAGVDVVSVANNHGMDYGLVGLQDTLAASASTGMPMVGIGVDDAQAYAPWIVEVKGQTIAVLGATQVLDGNLITAWTASPGKPGMASAKDEARLVTAVQAAQAVADTVVVFLHWGTEGQTCPNNVQPPLAQTLVDAGADVVVGGHAHRLQGAGRLGPGMVGYGLGNFAFYARGGAGAQTGVLTVTVTGRRVDAYSWTPAVISGGIPKPLGGGEAQAAIDRWNALRDCTGLAP
jgi:poly-gamma-glutamate synthesis protein (capsule biosynthesis protein)